MEILRKNRKKIIAIALFVVSAAMLSAQSFVEQKDAFQQSYIQEATGDNIKAVNTLKGIYDEGSYEINLRLGWLTYLAGNFTESKSYYSKAVSLMPYSVESRFGYIYPAAAMGNWAEVISQYEKILEILPNNTIAMHRLGLIYYGREEFDKALPLFEKVVNLYPFDYDGLAMLAWTNYKLGRTRESRVLFQKALLNTPNGTSAIEGLDLLK